MKCSVLARLQLVAIWEVLPPYATLWENNSIAMEYLFEKGYLDPPKSEKEWLQIAKEFEDQWNFLHCLGAIDEKHVNIQALANSGSIYFNCRKKRLL